MATHGNSSIVAGESHGQRSPAGCSPRGLTESVGHDSSDLVRMPEVSVYDICALTWLPHKQCFLLWVEVSQS